jgi:tetratricopeptide (TPR) repeat protein
MQDDKMTGCKMQDEARNTKHAERSAILSTKSRNILLLLILVLALGLRLWLWSRPAHTLANDETEYFFVGMDLAHGRGFAFYDTYRWLRAPLYPLFLGFFFWLGQDHARLATLAQVLLSTATVYGFYLLGRQLWPGKAGQRAGLIGALLAALLLPFATFPSLFMAETLFTFLLVASFLALLRVPQAAAGRRWRPSLSREKAQLLRNWRWALLAGFLFGLSALTRAVALAFIPIAAAWLWIVLWRQGRNGDQAIRRKEDPAKKRVGELARGWGRAMLLPALLVTAGLATIAPWTIRNAVVYQRFIPLDTGGAYSLWAFYEPHEELDEINRTLEAIPNPADRQAYAAQKWRERLAEDPMILTRKVVDAFPYLLRIKPIEDRFLPLPYREPEPLYFALALVLDDGLYALIAVTALAALILTPLERGKALALLWLLYNVGIMMVLHAEARYRHLLFPALIPYAGLALARGKALFGSRLDKGSGKAAPHQRAVAPDHPSGEKVWRWMLLVFLLAGWAYCFIAYSPWDWAALNLHRGYYQTLGQVNWALGRPEAALAAYQRAAELDERNPEPYYDWGRTLERLGRLEEAAQVYQWGWDVRSTYLPCSTALGNVLRRLGQDDKARTAFQGRYVEETDVVAWAWQHLETTPQEQIDIGNGLDFGYVTGVHAAEEGGGVTLRWTTAEARLRLTPTTTGPALLHLQLAAPRLGPAGPVPAEVWLGGTRVGQWAVSPNWETYETQPFPATAGQPLEFILRSTTFVPQQIVPDSPDTRSLGVQLDRAQIVSQLTCVFLENMYNGCTPFP